MRICTANSRLSSAFIMGRLNDASQYGITAKFQSWNCKNSTTGTVALKGSDLRGSELSSCRISSSWLFSSPFDTILMTTSRFSLLPVGGQFVYISRRRKLLPVPCSENDTGLMNVSPIRGRHWRSVLTMTMEHLNPSPRSPNRPNESSAGGSALPDVGSAKVALSK